MMDLGRLDFSIRIGIAPKAYRRRWLPVLGSAAIRWRKALNIFDRITLKTRTLGWDDKWIYMEQRIISKDIVHAFAIVKVLFVGKDGPIPIQEITNLIRPGLKSPRIPPIVKMWVEMEEEMRNRLKAES
jgi:acyl-CoA thioesterase FadM